MSEYHRAGTPERHGEASLVDHVVFIIKENRTYDQVFGDIKKGNGDPSLTIYPDSVTPNHHRLAEDFVLLERWIDNWKDLMEFEIIPVRTSAQVQEMIGAKG